MIEVIIIIALLLLVTALIMLYFSIMIGKEWKKENDILQNRIVELDRELKFQIQVKKTFEKAYDHLKNKK